MVEVGEGADLDAPGVGPADAGVAVGRRHPQQCRRRRGCRAAATPGARRARRRGPPRAGRSRRGSRCRASGGRRRRAARPSARCRRRGRARSSGRCSRSSGRSRAGRRRRREVGGVDGREALVQRAGRGEEPDRRARRGRRCTARSRPAAPTRGRAAARRAAAHAATTGDVIGCDGAHRVDGRADARRAAPACSRSTRGGPLLDASPSENRRCTAVELDAGAAVQVAGVEQRDADAGIGRGGDQRRRPSRWDRRTARRRARGGGSGTRRRR